MLWICCFQVFWPTLMLSALQMRCVVQPLALHDNVCLCMLHVKYSMLFTLLQCHLFLLCAGCQCICLAKTLYQVACYFYHSRSFCFAQVVNAWLKCFHVLVPLLDKTLIKSKILPVALAKGANDETSVQSRVICCAMLGSMAACLTKVNCSHHHPLLLSMLYQ